MTESPAPAVPSPNVEFVRFEVPGLPVPQGSMRAPAPGVVLHDKPKLRAWRLSIAATAAQHYKGPLLYGPIAIILAFTFTRPNSRPDDIYKTAPPDLDKLIRAVLDALTGVLWADDGQVCRIEAAKYLEDKDNLPGLIFSATLRSNKR